MGGSMSIKPVFNKLWALRVLGAESLKGYQSVLKRK